MTLLSGNGRKDLRARQDIMILNHCTQELDGDFRHPVWLCMAISHLQSRGKSEYLEQEKEDCPRHLTDIFVCRLNVTFVDKEGEEHKFQVAQGDNLLDIAQSEELEMEGEPHMRHGDRSLALTWSTRGLRWVMCLLDLSCHR